MVTVTSSGIDRIAKERKRQIEEEHYTLAHDIDHDKGELALAAACYAANGTGAHVGNPNDGDACSDAWPWAKRFDKRFKHDRIRQLEIAGALIAAEIDRLLLEKGSGLSGGVLF